MRVLALVFLLLMSFFSIAQAAMIKVSNDLDIHYESSGQGKNVILLVPGWTMSTEVYVHQLEHFKDSKDYRLIVIDPRSQGLSTDTVEGNFYEQHGRDIADFMKALGLHDVVLGGWSYGGFDVLAYVHQFGTDNLKGFIMMDSVPKCLGSDDPKNPNDWYWFKSDGSDGVREHFTQGVLLHREQLNDEFARYMVDNPHPEYMKWITRISNQTGDGVAALLNESGSSQNYEMDLTGMEGKVPLFYYMSQKSQRVDEWSRINTPSAMIVKFGKHLSFWEHPEHFNKALDEFLAMIK